MIYIFFFNFKVSHWNFGAWNGVIFVILHGYGLHCKESLTAKVLVSANQNKQILYVYIQYKLYSIIIL